jgi:DNA-binding transcriptional LysR family regulator
VIELGTVKAAAEAVAISQPAASKLMQHLESDSGLKLFDRKNGRLIPTAQARRLYQEIGRIFAGVRQVETAIAAVRREAQGRLVVGVLPALEGPLLQKATINFLKRNPKVYCALQSNGSRQIIQSLQTRQSDVGVITSTVDDPSLITEPLLEHPLVCVMPIGHPLAKLDVVRPEDLRDISFVSFSDDTHIGKIVASMFDAHGVAPEITVTAEVGTTACQFVAAGLGVSLIHPVFAAGVEQDLIARPFEPQIPFEFLLCYPHDAPDAHLVSDFIKETKALAAKLSVTLKKD